MTMHLVGPWLTTTNYKKRQKKLTKAEQAALDTSWKKWNKWAKQNRLPTMTWEEYLDYTYGKVKKSSKPVIPPAKSPQLEHRSSDHRTLYPSLNNGVCSGVALKKQPMMYTGTLIKGIATMHKSNAIPILDQKQAEEVAKMRR